MLIVKYWHLVMYVVCLFVCLFDVPLENFSLIWRRHHYRWRAWNFYLCLEPMIMEQWGFFRVPQLLWHQAVYNGQLLPSSWRWSCQYLFYDCFYHRSVATGIWTPACGANVVTHCTTAAVARDRIIRSEHCINVCGLKDLSQLCCINYLSQKYEHLP